MRFTDAEPVIERGRCHCGCGELTKIAPRTLGLPSWTRGVRVEKAGRASWVVVATESKGR